MQELKCQRHVGQVHTFRLLQQENMWDGSPPTTTMMMTMAFAIFWPFRKILVVVRLANGCINFNAIFVGKGEHLSKEGGFGC